MCPASTLNDLIFRSSDPATVQAEVRNVYGTTISLQLANDLIAFVEKAVRGDYTDK